MNENYYREKVIKLFEKIFVEVGDARSRIINCEDEIFTAYSLSGADGVPCEVKKHWKMIWSELNTEPPWKTIEGKEIMSSLNKTILKRKNSALKKYLSFFLEEFCRVIT
jgi:pullulanase